MNAPDYKRQTGDELIALLRYWMDNGPDWKYGGFHAKDPGTNADILWTFSAASWFARNDIYLAVARRAYEYIVANLLTTTGQPSAHAGHAGHAALIYGLSEYYYASGDLVALRQAISQFRLLQNDEPRYLAECANLYRHWPDDKLKQYILDGLNTSSDITTSWINQQAAETIGHKDWITHIPENPVTIADREAAVGYLNIWELTRDETWFHRSTEAWKASPPPDRSSPFKYARACMEIVRRLTDRERKKVSTF